MAKDHNTLCKTKSDATRILRALKDSLSTKISFDYDTTRGNRLLQQDMFFQSWTSRIREKVAAPQTIVDAFLPKCSLETTIDRCIHGLIERHPILCELAGLLHQSNTIDTHWNDTLKNTILDTLHAMHIYEALARYAADGNKKMVTSLIDFYSFEKWAMYKSRRELLTKTHPFTFVKSESVNWCLMQYISMSNVMEDTTLEPDEKQMLLSKMGKMVTFGLNTNIYEAVFADKVRSSSKNKYRLNSDAGKHGLLFYPYGIASVKNDILYFEDMSQYYASMYLAWNLCFICEAPNAHLLYAKLLQPYVLDAPPHAFMFRRALSLLITVQSFMCNALRKTPTYRNRYDMRKMHPLFAALNLKYANTAMIHNHGTTSYSYKLKKFFLNLPSLSKQMMNLIRTDPLKHMDSRKQFQAPRVSEVYRRVLRKTKKAVLRQRSTRRAH